MASFDCYRDGINNLFEQGRSYITLSPEIKWRFKSKVTDFCPFISMSLQVRDKIRIGGTEKQLSELGRTRDGNLSDAIN